MRRGLAALLFTIAAACLALAAGGWLLERLVYSPSASAELTEVVMRNDDIRQQITTLIASAAAPQLGVEASQLQATVDQYVRTNDAAIHDVLSQVVSQAHARMIGERDRPVQITGAQLVPIVRDQAVLNLPPITLPVQEITPLKVVGISLHWLTPLLAVAGVIALVAGLVTHPRRADAIYGIGIMLIFAAIALVVLLWLVPVYALGEVEGGVWTELMPAIGRHYLPFTLLGAFLLAAAGLGLMVGAAALGRRRAGRTPIDVSRYHDQRRWSR